VTYEFWQRVKPLVLLTARFGSASAIRTRFVQYEKVGFLEALRKSGLVKYDDLQGIAWK